MGDLLKKSAIWESPNRGRALAIATLALLIVGGATVLAGAEESLSSPEPETATGLPAQVTGCVEQAPDRRHCGWCAENCYYELKDPAERGVCVRWVGTRCGERFPASRGN